MSPKYLRQKIRRFHKKLQRYVRPLPYTVGLLVLGYVMYAVYMDTPRQTIDPTSYRPLLQLIAKAESSDNYNAYYGSPRNQDVTFTNMTIQEVLDWQQDFIDRGSPSSAVGRYQIINTTLEGLVKHLGIPPTRTFDQNTQDQLAITLIERRGAKEYVMGKLSKEAFAANLAKEWAALPKTIGDSPNASYYSDDGLNKSRVQVAELLSAIQPITTR
ncbi:MAG: hypothetical protein WBP22_03040 [Candidatus Saccharimonas sp.]